MDMHPPHLGAAMKFGEYLAGIQQALGVEGAFELLLAFQVGRAELIFHQVALLHAHPMLPGQNAADIDAKAQYIRPERLGAFGFAVAVGVIEDQRVQIAVAGMEDIDHAQPMHARQAADFAQNMG